MTDTVKPLTAKAKLALSRAELLAAMGYEVLTSEAGGAPKVVQLSKPGSTSTMPNLSTKVSRSLVGRWWRRSSLSSVFELSEPFLVNYAIKHPARLVAYGASTGAIVWLLKPWRLLSVATVVTILLKSSNVTEMVADLASKLREPAGDTCPPVPGTERP